MFDVIKLGVVPDAAQTTPGGAQAFALTVQNASSIVDRYHFSIEGVPPEWTEIEPAVASLFPGAVAHAVLTVRPPAGVEAVAGDYSLTFRASSEDDPSIAATALLTLTISTVGVLALEVYPPDAHGREGTYRLRLRNGANKEAAVDLSARDNEEGLLFDLEPQGTMHVPAGGEVEATARVSPKKKETIGQPHPYEIEFTARPRGEDGAVVDGADGALAAGLTGQARFTYEPRLTALTLPRWLRALPLWLLALLALLLGLLLLLAGAGAGAVLAHGAQAPRSPRVVPIGLPVVKAFELRSKPKGGLALDWKTAGARGATLDGKPASPNGELPVSLDRTATHVLAVTGAGGTVVRVLRLIAPSAGPGVNKPLTTPLLPRVKTFTARASARAGKLDLVWAVTGAQTVTLDGQVVVPQGRTIVSWVRGRTHKLKAINTLGTVTSTVILPVTPRPPLVYVLVVSPPKINDFSFRRPRLGHPYELSWQTSKAANVTLDGRVVATHGVLPLPPPLKTGLHVLSAQNANGRSMARMRLVVTQTVARTLLYTLALPRVLRFTLDSAAGTPTINWRVQGAGKVLLQGHTMGTAGTTRLSTVVGTAGGAVRTIRLVATNDVGVVAEVVTVAPAPTVTVVPATTAPSPTARAHSTATMRPTATTTATTRPTITATRTPRPVRTATPTPRPTKTATPTPRPTRTATRTPLPVATSTRVVEPTPKPLVTATHVVEPTPRPSATATQTPHSTATATQTPRPTATATRTPRPTATATQTPRPTMTATRTPRPTMTATATQTPSPTATATRIIEPTPKPLATSTRVVEPTPRPLATSTQVVEPTPRPLATSTRVVEPTPKPF